MFNPHSNPSGFYLDKKCYANASVNIAQVSIIGTLYHPNRMQLSLKHGEVHLRSLELMDDLSVANLSKLFVSYGVLQMVINI